MLEDYPREMEHGPTVNLVSGQLVACYGDSCDTYKDGEWNHLVETRSARKYSSSAVNDHRMLLLGGGEFEGPFSNTTEWIPVDGSPAQPGPFNANVDVGHCVIQTGPNLIVVTGGMSEWPGGEMSRNVWEYQLTGDFTKTPLTPMWQGRTGHACGVYQGVGGQQVNHCELHNFNLI